MYVNPVTNDQILATLYAVAPQFITADGPTLARYATLISILQSQVNQYILGNNSALAFAYLLAHMLSTTPITGVADALAEGELNIKYALSPESSILSGTSYGRAYIDLCKRTIFAPTVTQGYYLGFPGYWGWPNVW